MDFIKMLREDNDLSDLLCDVCDMEILPEFKEPEDEFEHLAYSIQGKTFAGTGSCKCFSLDAIGQVFEFILRLLEFRENFHVTNITKQVRQIIVLSQHFNKIHSRIPPSFHIFQPSPNPISSYHPAHPACQIFHVIPNIDQCTQKYPAEERFFGCALKRRI